MTLIEIAQIYVDLVQLDDAIMAEEFVAKDEVGSLRSKYHQMFMDKLQMEGIQFRDRFEAMRIAFELVKTQLSPPTEAYKRHPRSLPLSAQET